ncbi:hypothetical protein GCM10028821_27030 [Hymenobacter jeollabukensis]
MPESVGAAYLWGMKKTCLLALFAWVAVLATSCTPPPNAEQDPNADAAYKRSHRAEGYREAQSSNPNAIK